MPPATFSVGDIKTGLCELEANALAEKLLAHVGSPDKDEDAKLAAEQAHSRIRWGTEDDPAGRVIHLSDGEARATIAAIDDLAKQGEDSPALRRLHDELEKAVPGPSVTPA
jgi:hypothetical protein